jgi:hypothetical protein
MPDQFDVQRQLDGAADELVDGAMDKLAECKDKAEERRERLVRLDDTHYFDPQNKQVLFKDGDSYANIGHNAHFEAQAAYKVEEEARSKGYTRVEGGMFWDAGARRLYVRNDGHYVLYSIDRH